tara:strand:- start:5914 stop:7710 length:1797 start_codon:yes stop_codon:yes gene_type:complete
MIEEILNKLFNDSILENINRESYLNIFKLPIELIDNKIELDKNIIKDLELLNDDEIQEKYSLYHNIFNNKTLFGTTNLDMWSKYYTNDINFLLDSQNLYKNFKDNDFIDDSNNIVNDDIIYEIIIDTIEDDAFVDRFHYIDLPIFKNLNKNDSVLQVLALKNLSSPALSLLMPIFFLILPFFIIKIQGNNITLDIYIKFLKNLFGNHIIGQLLTNFIDAPFEKKIYLLLSLGMFILQIYSNINTCKTYYKNIKYVNNTLNTVRVFLTNSLKKIENYLLFSYNLVTYNRFNDELIKHKNIIEKYLISINKISEYKLNVKKILELGYLMKCFYILNNDNQLIETIKYCFGFTGYIENINQLQKQIYEKNINFCTFIDNDKKIIIKNSYFAALNNNNPIKNNIKLDNNIIITGPNAAGKTTILKSILYNSILSQQIGCGFYSKANLKIYDFIHCYINIPDTGDRDSLFQSECRTCKIILDSIMNNPSKNHLCVFDELYSGTNPYEAIASGYSYLDFISKNNNVNFILTTHYIDLCRLLKSKTNKNYSMEILETDLSYNYNYTYKFLPGISKIKGGIKILKDLEYPNTIIESMNKTIKKLSF